MSRYVIFKKESVLLKTTAKPPILFILTCRDAPRTDVCGDNFITLITNNYSELQFKRIAYNRDFTKTSVFLLSIQTRQFFLLCATACGKNAL